MDNQAEPLVTCPRCSQTLQRAPDNSPIQPQAGLGAIQPGDFAICSRCSLLMVVEAPGKARESVPIDADDLTVDQMLFLLRTVLDIRAANRMKMHRAPLIN